MVITQVL